MSERRVVISNFMTVGLFFGCAAPGYFLVAQFKIGESLQWQKYRRAHHILEDIMWRNFVHKTENPFHNHVAVLVDVACRRIRAAVVPVGECVQIAGRMIVLCLTVENKGVFAYGNECDDGIAEIFFVGKRNCNGVVLELGVLQLENIQAFQYLFA